MLLFVFFRYSSNRDTKVVLSAFTFTFTQVSKKLLGSTQHDVNQVITTDHAEIVSCESRSRIRIRITVHYRTWIRIATLTWTRLLVAVEASFVDTRIVGVASRTNPTAVLRCRVVAMPLTVYLSTATSDRAFTHGGPRTPLAVDGYSQVNRVLKECFRKKNTPPTKR